MAKVEWMQVIIDRRDRIYCSPYYSTHKPENQILGDIYKLEKDA